MAEKAKSESDWVDVKPSESESDWVDLEPAPEQQGVMGKLWSAAQGVGTILNNTIGLPGQAVRSGLTSLLGSEDPNAGITRRQLPLAGQVLTDTLTGQALGKGLGLLGNFFRTPPSRAEEIEKFATGQLGLPPTAERLSQGRQPVQEAFQKAEQVPGKYPVGKTPPRQSKLVDEHGRPIEIPGKPITGSYKDLLDQEQTLAFQARRMADPVKKASLNAQREAVLDQMAGISEAASKANTVAYRDIAGKAIMSSIESGGGNLLGKMDTLLQRRPQYLKAFGIDSPQAVEAFRSMVQTIERTPMNPQSQALVVGKWLMRHAAYLGLAVGAGALGAYGYHRYGS